MSDDAVGPGSILHWEGFRFPNGTEANKFFVIVGAQPGHNYLAIMATSQQKGATPILVEILRAAISTSAVTAKIGFRRTPGCCLKNRWNSAPPIFQRR